MTPPTLDRWHGLRVVGHALLILLALAIGALVLALDAIAAIVYFTRRTL